MGDAVQARIIVHVDMDAFFAAVEQLDNPQLRGRPVVVGADPKTGRGRGVVCAASYEAREFGIHSALPISKAYRLCSSAVFVRPRFERYIELSRSVMEILGGFSPVVEQISIDEAFLDCTGTERLFGPPEKLGRMIKDRIFEATGLTASVGIAPNKSIAKIASDLEKPNGLSICRYGGEREFLARLPVKALWGAGKKTVGLLRQMGLHTIGDVAAANPADLDRLFGQWGRHLWTLANGIDDRPVGEEGERKSYSEEITFESDVDDERLVERTLFELADELTRRIRRDGLRCKTVTLKLRMEGFETHTRSLTLPEPVDDTQTIRSVAVDHFRGYARSGRRVRLVGINVSNLVGADEEIERQLDLFSCAEKNGSSRIQPVHDSDKLLDALKKRFGDKVKRATLLGRNARRGGDEETDW